MKKNARGVFINISWKFDIIFIRYIARYIILSKANKNSYLRSLRQIYFNDREERGFWGKKRYQLIVKCTYTVYSQTYIVNNSLLYVYVMRTCVGFVRLHHANDVTRAKYAPMASHTPWLQTDEYTVRPGSSLVSLNRSFLIPWSVIETIWLLLRRYLVIEWTRYNNTSMEIFIY